MKLRFSTRAKLQVISIQEYIAARSPEASRRVGGRIREAADILRDIPYAGRPGRRAGTREWVVRGLPYIIVYEVRADDDEVMILDVFHGAQRRE